MRKLLLLISLLTSVSVQAESPYAAPDKVGHYASGATIAAVGSIFASPEVGLAATIIAAGGKEWYDYKHPESHHADRRDFNATILGGLLVYAALKIDNLKVTYVDKTPTINYTWSIK